MTPHAAAPGLGCGLPPDLSVCPPRSDQPLSTPGPPPHRSRADVILPLWPGLGQTVRSSVSIKARPGPQKGVSSRFTLKHAWRSLPLSQSSPAGKSRNQRSLTGAYSQFGHGGLEVREPAAPPHDAGCRWQSWDPAPVWLTQQSPRCQQLLPPRP